VALGELDRGVGDDAAKADPEYVGDGRRPARRARHARRRREGRRERDEAQRRADRTEELARMRPAGEMGRAEAGRVDEESGERGEGDGDEGSAKGHR